MAVKVLIPTPLRAFAGKRDSVQFEAKTVGEALKQLTTEYAELRKHLDTDDGKIRSFVNVYVNDEDIRYLDDMNTAVTDGVIVALIPAVAGG